MSIDLTAVPVITGAAVSLSLRWGVHRDTDQDALHD
jgi:hypothetical protein